MSTPGRFLDIFVQEKVNYAKLFKAIFFITFNIYMNIVILHFYDYQYLVSHKKSLII